MGDIMMSEFYKKEILSLISDDKLKKKVNGLLEVLELEVRSDEKLKVYNKLNAMRVYLENDNLLSNHIMVKHKELKQAKKEANSKEK